MTYSLSSQGCICKCRRGTVRRAGSRDQGIARSEDPRLQHSLRSAKACDGECLVAPSPSSERLRGIRRCKATGPARQAETRRLLGAEAWRDEVGKGHGGRVEELRAPAALWCPSRPSLCPATSRDAAGDNASDGRNSGNPRHTADGVLVQYGHGWEKRSGDLRNALSVKVRLDARAFPIRC